MIKYKNSHFFIILVIISILGCNETKNEEEFDIYGNYSCILYCDGDLIISEGSFKVFGANSEESVRLGNFVNVVDSIDAAQYLSNRTVSCIIENDTIEFVTANLPNFGSFVMKGIFMKNN